MTLEFRVSEVPEGLESHYKKDGNDFVLDVAGVVDTATYDTLKTEAEETKKKVDEFRNNNITLRKQIEGNLKSTGDTQPPNIDDLVNEAVNTATSEMKKKIEGIEAERQTLSSQLEEVVLSDRVKDIAVRYGVHETALPDVVARARSVFIVEDGKPMPKDKKAKDENGEMYKPETWLKKLEQDAPHLFKASSGSGATRPVNGKWRDDANRSSTQKIADALNKGTTSNVKSVM